MNMPNSMPRCCLIAISLLIFCATATAADRIVFLGDSLTAGYGVEPDQAYPALVGEMLQAKGKEVVVVNAGVSGDTTAGGLRRINWLLKQPMDTLVIALGANDALRGLPVAETEANLRKMVEAARERYPDLRIILGGMLAPPNMGTAYREAFASVYPSLAKSASLALVPFMLEGVAGDPRLNLADGIHPNPEGHRRVARLFVDILDP